MGTLVARKYPTRLFANAADHTYVECGTGAVGWGCWGGKSNGTEFRQGQGSTLRADAIAGHDEKAGIRCYLINGVCHQAANRILISAGITVAGARGYGVSQSLYGTYGRVGGWPCRSPFNQFPDVTGDHPHCEQVSMMSVMSGAGNPGEADESELASVLALYRDYDRLFSEDADPSPGDVAEFDMAHFSVLLDHRLESPDAAHKAELMDVRRGTGETQLSLERQLADGVPVSGAFVDAINQMTVDFQHAIAERTSAGEYERLFGLSKDEVIVLADPEIVEREFGGEAGLAE